MRKKYMVCDAGSLISLTGSCLAELLYFFKEKYSLNFVMPPAVEEETVSYPLRKNIKKYMFSAIRIKDAIDDGVIEIIRPENIDKERERVMHAANNIFYARGKPIKLIQPGETEMLILAKEIGAQNILLDERTMRLLVEAPFSLKDHMEQEFGVNLMINKSNLSSLSDYTSDMNAFRSSELVMLAYENGFFKKFQNLERQALEAALYRIKFSGCSIRFDEISSYLRWTK